MNLEVKHPLWHSWLFRFGIFWRYPKKSQILDVTVRMKELPESFEVVYVISAISQSWVKFFPVGIQHPPGKNRKTQLVACGCWNNRLVAPKILVAARYLEVGRGFYIWTRHFFGGPERHKKKQVSLHFKLNHGSEFKQTYCRRVLFILASMPCVDPPVRSLALSSSSCIHGHVEF